MPKQSLRTLTADELAQVGGAGFDIGGLIQQFGGLAQSFKSGDAGQIGGQIGSLISTFKGFFGGGQPGGGQPGGPQPGQQPTTPTA